MNSQQFRFNQAGQLACIGLPYQLPEQVDAFGYGPQNINLFGDSEYVFY
jgi:hypothetical protein